MDSFRWGQEAKVSSLREHFEMFFGNIEPEDARKAIASRSANDLRDYLERADAFTTVDPHTRLIGSYARETAVGEIKDVDLLVFVPRDRTDDSPSKTLKDLRAALADFPGAVSVELLTQRRSIRVELDGGMCVLDVVPAFAPDGTHEPLLVPDRLQSEWIASHPLGYAALLSEKNAARQRKPVRLIKAFKHWRDVHMKKRRPRSYLLEVLVLEQLESLDMAGTGIGQCLKDAFDAVYERCRYAFENDTVPRIADPLLGHDLAKGWEPEESRTFARRLDESRKWACRAVNEEHETAVELWQKILGDEFFPGYANDCAECEGGRLMAAESAGGVFVTTGREPRLTTLDDTRPRVKVPDGHYWSDRCG